MRFSVTAVVLACATLTSAEFLLATDASDAVADQPNLIQWDVNDFSDNIDIFVADEDADENDENAGIKIADSTPNVGTFTWVPNKGEAGGKKKKKIWGKDKKGKKKKGKKLIGIIILPPAQIVTQTIVQPPRQSIVQPPPAQVTTPGQPAITITSIGTLTRTVPTQITATTIINTHPPGQPPVQTTQTPGGRPPVSSQPPNQSRPPTPIETPKISDPQRPPLSSSFQPPFPSQTSGRGQPTGGVPGVVPTPTTLVTRPPAGQITSSQLSNTLFRPTPTASGPGGVAPPLFTGAAGRLGGEGNGVFVGGLAGLLVLGML